MVEERAASDIDNGQLASEGGAQTTRRKGKRLVVAGFAKKKPTTKESTFEAAWAKAFGRPSWHMAVREKGWPDRYLGSGRWVEFKTLDCLGTQNYLDKAQIRKLNELTRDGEDCYYCAKFEDKIILVPWVEFRDEHNLAPCNCPSYAYKDMKEDIRYVIGRL
jgi:hypothetical protein